MKLWAIPLLVLMCGVGAGCGKKEWPQPMAQEEQVFVDTVDVRRYNGCLQLAVKLGGNLANVEFFRVEIETDGCPTCPFRPTIVRQVYPFDRGVRREENSYLFSLCGLELPPSIRLRVGVDNTFATIPPALSAVLTIPTHP
jgi:hypothetical protein